MFSIIHNHYDNRKTIINKSKVPHDPICQRCEKRFSYHGQKDDKCSGFVSTGSLMIVEQSKPEVEQ